MGKITVTVISLFIIIIAASASGGRAGQGALIGAGTGIIGSALLDALTGPSTSARRSGPPPQDDYYYADHF